MLSLGCQRAEAGGEGDAAARPGPAVAPSETAPGPSLSASAAAPRSDGPGAAVRARAPLSHAEFARAFRELSEPDRYFFSDNYVSNETSYLQVSDELAARAAKGGAYVGVGPEQNFTYIALTDPDIAYIVDIRRGNALEHLLYKAAFELADSRSELLALLVARRHEAAGAPGSEASIEDVMKHVDRVKPDEKDFARIHRLLVDRIRDGYGIELSAKDLETLQATHRAFFDDGLDLRFELHAKNGRKYPSFRDLMVAKGPTGRPQSFLGSELAFRRVQALERANRVIPVVGDFAGDHALSSVGAALRKQGLPVSVFYVSNVEQYLMEPDKWKAWTRNVDALPSNEQSLFVRCYLDQGRRHPSQLAGHRTATVVQSFDHFKWRARTRGYGSFFQLATDGSGPDAGSDVEHPHDAGP